MSDSPHSRRAGAGRWWFVLAAAAIMALQGWLAITHEPFVDEWQALQIAVQSPDMAALLKNLSYEGHPPLWHLTLRLLAAIVGPGHALAAAAVLFGLGAQALLLFRSPFPPWLRLLLAMSEPVLFDFGVVSRSYTLGMFLAFAAMALWDRRRAFWVPMALLPFTEFLFGVISLGLLAIRWGERRPWWPGLALWLALSLLAAWTIIPAPDFVPVNNPTPGILPGTLVWAITLSEVAVPLQWSGGVPHWNEVPANVAWLVLWMFLMAMMIDQTRRRPLDRAALLGFVAVTWVFFAFMYSLAIRHMLLLSLLMVAVQWRQGQLGIPARPLFGIWAGLGAACGLVAAGANLVMPFERAPEVAAFIEDNGLQDETWIAVPAQHGQGVSAMTGVLFEGAERGCRSDFIRWNLRPSITSADRLGAWVARQAQMGERFYLLSDIRVAEGAPATLLRHVEGGYYDKQYWIYRVGAADAPRREAAPRCIPEADPMPPLGH